MTGAPPILPVSVVIPTRDRPESLRRLLESILAGEACPAEVIIADQSADPAGRLPSRPGVQVRVLRPHPPGVSRGRNVGIEAASHDVVVLVDDDMVVSDSWLRSLVQGLVAAPHGSVVSGGVQAPAGASGVPSLTSGTQPVTFEGRPGCDPLFSGNMAALRSTLTAIGGFDERLGPGTRLPAAEDNDLGFRLLEAGTRIEFVPDAVATHTGARAGSERIALDWRYGRGQGAFYAKHASSSDRYVLRRFSGEITERVRRGVRSAPYVLGLVTGALEWCLRYRLPSILLRSRTHQRRATSRSTPVDRAHDAPRPDPTRRR